MSCSSSDGDRRAGPHEAVFDEGMHARRSIGTSRNRFRTLFQTSRATSIKLELLEGEATDDRVARTREVMLSLVRLVLDHAEAVPAR